MKLSNKFIKLLVCFVLTLPLAGCFKAEIFVDIHPNGSSTVAGSVGLNSQAKAFLSMGGENIEEELFGLNSNDESTRTSRWVDGEYEWVKIERDFETIEELNNAVKDSESLDHFYITRKTGLFQNQIILDGEFDLSSTGESEIDFLGLLTSDMINIRFLARMPGTIQEHNGLTDINDPNMLVWTLNFDGVTSIHAKSVTWNYLNIGLIAAGFLLLAILVIVLIVLLVIRRNKSLAVTSLDLDPSVSSVNEKDESHGIPTISTDDENG